MTIKTAGNIALAIWAGDNGRYMGSISNQDITPKAATIAAFVFCDPDWIRTNDPQLRRLMLYPTELPDQSRWRNTMPVMAIALQSYKK